MMSIFVRKICSRGQNSFEVFEFLFTPLSIDTRYSEGLLRWVRLRVHGVGALDGTSPQRQRSDEVSTSKTQIESVNNSHIELTI